MGLSDRIEEEMYVDKQSILEDQFDRAKELCKIYEDNTIDLMDDLEELEPADRILTHLVAQRYISEANEEISPSLSNDYFYDRIDKTESTIRGYCSDLVDAGLIEKTESQGEHELVIERLGEILDRIKSKLTTQ